MTYHSLLLHTAESIIGYTTSMETPVKPTKAKSVGRRAIQWKQLVDRHKAASADTPNQPDDKRAQFAKDNSDSAYAEHALEDVERPMIKNIEEKKLRDTVKESDHIIVKAETVFPFRLFPTIVSIDRHKLTLVYRRFLGAHQTLSVPIENIKNIQANVGPFFGSLVITSDQFINSTQEVDFLTKADTVKVQRIVQGAMVAVKEEIDISKVDIKKLREHLENLGGSGSGH